ncbi:hypothetical protein QBC42DRAFT_231145 [Cladorrhinum samala]|uniref:DUF1308 domain-containing protein n=1 Tax=Cladorrhinum samala TaxID=585594 RepID=A0AAV9HGQ7_9PEZI|nr:hypothetical protein QBC42DRAFT_231145 [Cladorrhinum samala]
MTDNNSSNNKSASLDHDSPDPDKAAETSQEESGLSDRIQLLVTQWQACIKELQHLELAADAASRPIRGLHAMLKVQQRAMEKVVQKQDASSPGAISPAQYMGIKSCCWDDRWAVVKKCRGLVAINKDFPRSPRLPVPRGSGWLAFKDQPFQEKTVSVDAVVDSGATWIKFLSISPKTLEYQVMAEGYESEPDHGDGDGDGDDAGRARAEDHVDGLRHTEFADTVSKIILAARWNHCHHLHLILPGLQEGKLDVVDRVLKYLRTKIGGQDVKVDVSCTGSSLLADPPPPVDEAIRGLIQDRDVLVADDCGRLTETVNLDPSALVALVTDLHHGIVPLQPVAQQDIITRSVLDHETDNNELVSRQDILATVLYPALRGRKLVCTQFAADYFRKLIDAISTHSEEVRASLVLPSSDSSEPLGESELHQKLQQWSTVPVPNDLRLPVQIVDDIDLPDVEPLVAAGKLPPMAFGVARDLSRLNRSVYLYGWANRITTITGHRGIERQVRLSIASHWTRDTDASLKGRHADDLPPDIWHRHLGGYLIHRDKPKDWRDMIPGGQIPDQVIRWTNPWTTWGRGISTYGLPDTKTWEGVGHADKQSFGRKMTGRESKGERIRNGNGKLLVSEVLTEDGQEEEQQS